MRTFTVRFAAAAAYCGALTVIGTVGYRVIEEWSLLDALYMTAITLTSVGYEEVHPLSEVGQIFTMFLLVGGITGIGIWFALITAFIVEIDLTDLLRRRRNERELVRMNDHVVVCGAGRTGRQVIEELVATGQPFVVIERDRRIVEELYEVLPEGLVITGDATLDHNLEEARVETARALVASLSADADNLFVCLSARHLSPDLMIVARAHEEQAMDKMLRAGADRVVSPNVSSAVQMASFIVRPSVMSLLDVMTHSGDLSLRLEQAEIPSTSTLAGQTLLDAAIPQRTGLIVIAVEKDTDGERRFLFNPVASTRLDAGDELIVLGEPEQVDTLRRYVGS
jgi:voltage-gated potassium channel